jgi:uncharacterized protein (TIGR01777 family)
MTKVALSGSTGFVGSNIKQSLQDKGYQVIPVGRTDFKESAEDLAAKLAGSEVIIHLAGAPIVKRWTESYKKELYHSRIDTTSHLVASIKAMKVKPSLFLSTSAIGIYQDDREHTEESEAYNTGFMGKICNDWEAHANAASPYTRVVIFRLGVVLGKGGGALQTMLPLFKMGLGGKIGSGKQGFSWIHLADLVRAYHFMIENKSLSGVFNLTSPQPVSNAEFTRQLAKELHRPALFPVPPLALKILYGEGAQSLTSGSFVRPKRLIQSSYKFDFPTIDKALRDIVK